MGNSTTENRTVTWWELCCNFLFDIHVTARKLQHHSPWRRCSELCCRPLSSIATGFPKNRPLCFYLSPISACAGSFDIFHTPRGVVALSSSIPLFSVLGARNMCLLAVSEFSQTPLPLIPSLHWNSFYETSWKRFRFSTPRWTSSSGFLKVSSKFPNFFMFCKNPLLLFVMRLIPVTRFPIPPSSPTHLRCFPHNSYSCTTLRFTLARTSPFRLFFCDYLIFEGLLSDNQQFWHLCHLLSHPQTLLGFFKFLIAENCKFLYFFRRFIPSRCTVEARFLFISGVFAKKVWFSADPYYVCIIDGIYLKSIIISVELKYMA